MLDIIQEYGKVILQSVGITLLLAIVGTFGGSLLSLLLVDARTQVIDKKRDNILVKIYKYVVKTLTTIYITVFRGTPMIIQAMVLYYGLNPFLTNFKFWSPLFAGLIIVVLNTAAYVAEVLRGSVNSLDVGQMEAARSLGFSRRQALMKFIYPQAIKNSLPSIGNEFIVNLKDTAVLSVIGVADIFYTTRQIAGTTYDYINSFMVAGVIYLILTGLTSIVVNKLEKGRSNGGNERV